MPFLLKLVVLAGALFVVLAAILGARPEIAFAVTTVVVMLSFLGYAIVALVFHRQVGVLRHGPAVLRNLVRLQKALQPGQRLFFRGFQRTPPALRIGLRRLLLTCTCEETFVQTCYDTNFQELPVYRIALATDGALFWTLSNQGRSDLTLMTLGEGGVPIGDEAFDSVVRVVGPAPLAMALLNHERRRELLDILGQHWSPVSLQCDPPFLQLSPRTTDETAEPDPTVHSQLGPTITALARILHRLAVTPADLVSALAANATADVCGPVRRRNLEVLAAHFPQAPETAAAIARARQDPAVPVRAWLAMRKGGD